MNSRTEKIIGMASKNSNQSIVEKVVTFFRMLKNHVTGQFQIKKTSMVLAVLGIIYIISPLDFIPEIAFGPIGLLDDAAIFAFVLSRINKELDRFTQWETSKSYANASDGEVIVIKNV